MVDIFFYSKSIAPEETARGVIFVDAIPKNQSGKILRKELKKQLLKLKGPVKSKL